MIKSHSEVSTHLVLEVLGANRHDLAQFLNVSLTAAIDYNRGQYSPVKEKAQLLNELTSLIVRAGKSRKSLTGAPSKAELDRMRRAYFHREVRIYRLELRLITGRDHRAYALRTENLLNELDPLIADRGRKDPIATIVRMARARNTKRLHNHSLDKIAGMEATLAGLRASQEVIVKVLNRYDKGWKKRALDAAKGHKEKVVRKKK